jgi:hypothetical protein
MAGRISNASRAAVVMTAARVRTQSPERRAEICRLAIARRLRTSVRYAAMPLATLTLLRLAHERTEEEGDPR